FLQASIPFSTRCPWKKTKTGEQVFFRIRSLKNVIIPLILSQFVFPAPIETREKKKRVKCDKKPTPYLY
ncbi:MAG: hypothetical protein P8Y00_04570, partial [Deltaproteobacteria bacterium]